MGVIIALVVSFGALIIGFLGEGGHVGALISWTPALIVFGGTIGSSMLAFPVSDLKKIGRIMKSGLLYEQADLNQLVAYFYELSVKSKKDGLLSLESEVALNPDADPFLKKGIQSLVDGESHESISDSLGNEIDRIEERHKIGAAIFNSAGGTAPTMGIVGTILGLVHVLEGLAEADMSSLGKSIASAFLATLYGLASANLIFLPMGNRLKINNQKELLEKELILEGILLLEKRVSPKTIQEKLMGFLNGDEKDEKNGSNTTVAKEVVSAT